MPYDLPSTILFFARLLIGGGFLHAALRNLPVLDRLTAFLATRGVPMPRETLLVGTAVQSIAGILLVLGVLLVPAALALVAFTVVATAIFHNFWDFSDDQRVAKRISFNANLIILGGLMAMLSAAL